MRKHKSEGGVILTLLKLTLVAQVIVKRYQKKLLSSVKDHRFSSKTPKWILCLYLKPLWYHCALHLTDRHSRLLISLKRGRAKQQLPMAC